MEPISPRQLLRRIREHTYSLALTSRRVAESGFGALSCRPGCAFCCYQKITCPVEVAVPIYLFLRQEGRWSPALRARLVEADWHMSASDHVDYHGEKRACVFLAEESYGRGMCTVHSVRPMGCVATFARGEPENCGEPEKVGDQIQVNLNPETMRSLGELLNGVRMGLNEPPLVLMTLPGAVLWAEHLVERTAPPDILRLRLDPTTTTEEQMQGDYRTRTVPFDIEGKKWTSTRTAPGSR